MTVMSKSQRLAETAKLGGQWRLNDAASELECRLEFKGYAKAVYCANLCAALCDRENHHADISFGWGYCQLRITTHDAGGLTDKDFSLAQKIETALAL